MVVKFIRWLMGYVSFNLKCGLPEKFINLSVRGNIKIWNIQKLPNGISAQCIAGDYFGLRNVSKKCSAKIRLKSKFGLPFILKRYRKRKGIVVGMLLFITILYILSLYIWTIDIHGNNHINSDEILNVMSDLGLSPGSLKNRIDAQATEQEAMVRLPNVSWISINMRGSHADIQIKERTLAPQIVEESKPCNIKAKTDAVIERIETYKGSALVKEGDAVLKGQTLISGIVEDSFGKSSFVHSQGKVYGYTRRKLEKTVKLSQIKAVDTGQTIKRYRFKCFGVEVPLNLWYKTDDSYRYEFSVCKSRIGHMELPFVLYKEIWFEQTGQEVTFSYEEALSEARALIESSEKDLFSESIKVLEREYHDNEVDGCCILSGTYKCFEDLGVSEEFELEVE